MWFSCTCTFSQSYFLNSVVPASEAKRRKFSAVAVVVVVVVVVIKLFISKERQDQFKVTLYTLFIHYGLATALAPFGCSSLYLSLILSMSIDVPLASNSFSSLSFYLSFSLFFLVCLIAWLAV